MAAGIEVLGRPDPTTSTHEDVVPSLKNHKDLVDRVLESVAASNPVLNYPSTDFKLEDHPIGEFRPLKVVVIGGGLSGILAGILLPAKVPGLEFKIYEKNKDLGGTWLENVYPGVRCDLPAHVYQSTFEPNTQWSEIFARGAEIRDYWQGVAKKHNVYQYADFGKRVLRTEFDHGKSKWVLSIENVDTQEKFVEEADFILTAIGRFNAWKLPDIPGLNDYEGHLRHTSNWDPSFDPKGKTVAVIGNGASGIQVVPNLQRVVKRLDHYARSKTWIAASWAGDVRTFEPQPYSKEQKESFQDPEVYLSFRKALEEKYWTHFGGGFRGSKKNEGLREACIEMMAQRVKRKPELISKIVPDFSPSCRRLTPGPGYLEALCEPNVDFIQTRIKRFTKTGIETEDGVERQVDAILCATGANVNFAPPFSIISKGIDLRDAWRPDGKYGFPYTYLGLASPEFPNLFFIDGPHATGTSGTVPHAFENQITYYAKVLRKVASEGIKTIKPSARAADDFVAYCDAYFPQTVFTDNCSSWYNGGRPGGRIHGVWPGSASHNTFARRNPRWEDFEYEYLNESGNRFGYFGNGWATKEVTEGVDLTSYLRLPKDVDLRDVHESWWDL